MVDPNGKTFWSRGTDVNLPSGEKDKTSGKELYKDTVMSKYGNWHNWSDYQAARYDRWGMNTLGAWTNSILYDNKIAYVEVLDFYATYKSTWTKCNGCYIPDFYDPEFLESVRSTIRLKALSKVNDPYYMGHILDNEVYLGPQWFNNAPTFQYYVNFDKSTYGWKAARALLADYYQNNITLFNRNW